MQDMVKTCKSCGEAKSLLDFPKRRDQEDEHHFWCFPCKRAKDVEYGKKWRVLHPDQKRSSSRRWKRKADEERRYNERSRIEKYGMDDAAFDRMVAGQGGRCLLCPQELTESAHVDHDHSCCPGKKSCGECIRGILCQRCNMALGMFDDDPNRLLAAAAYVMTRRDVLNTHVVDQTA